MTPEARLRALAERVDDPATEEWRPTQYPFYEVSSLGRIRSLHRWTARVLVLNAAGPYLKFFYRSGKSAYVHRVACLAFHGEPPPGWFVDHIDFDKRNNSASNLRWLPEYASCSRQRQRRIPLAAVEQIRACDGTRMDAIFAWALGCTKRYVSQIRRGVVRRDLDGERAGA